MISLKSIVHLKDTILASGTAGRTYLYVLYLPETRSILESEKIVRAHKFGYVFVACTQFFTFLQTSIARAMGEHTCGQALRNPGPGPDALGQSRDGGWVFT